MKTPALLSAALLALLICPVTPAAGSNPTPITVLVTNSVLPIPDKIYSTHVVYRGILLGGLRRLNESTDFTFTYTEHKDYGPFLESVNGLHGSTQERTYWQLLVNNEGNITVPDVGIGCYIPKANDQIILKYTKW